MQRFKEFHRRGKLIFGCCFCLYRGISITSAIFLLQRTEQVKHGFYRMKLEVWVSPFNSLSCSLDSYLIIPHKQKHTPFLGGILP